MIETDEPEMSQDGENSRSRGGGAGCMQDFKMYMNFVLYAEIYSK